MINKIEFNIGDWSDDGHGICEKVYINCNYNSTILREAYLDASQKLGIALHDSAKHCTPSIAEYGENKLAAEVVTKLEEIGYDFGTWKDAAGEVSWTYEHEQVVKAIMLMISTQLPNVDWEYSVIDAQKFNGDRNFTDFIGYGIFDDN